MAIHPLFRVLVRDYRLLETNILVQSPNTDLKAQLPRTIVRPIDGPYMGEPRTLEAITEIRDIAGPVYYHATHGVCVSLNSQTDSFPVWVCLQRDEHRRQNHIWVLNLTNLEFSSVHISRICWVPSHESTDGNLYTVVGGPGKNGYEKEMRLPTVVQKIGVPEQVKFDLTPATRLSSLTVLQPERQEQLFNFQFMSIRGTPKNHNGKLTHSLRGSRQLQPCITSYDKVEFPMFYNNSLPSGHDEKTGLLSKERIMGTQEQVPEGFCRCHCCHLELGTTRLTCPLHMRITDDRCRLGSFHQQHCIFAAYRPNFCVLDDSRGYHEHCVTDDSCSSVVDGSSAPTACQPTDSSTVDSTHGSGNKTGLDDDIGSLLDEPCFRGYEWVVESRDSHTWGNLNEAVPYLESRPTSPIQELVPGTQRELERLDNLPDPILDDTVARGVIWEQRVLDYHRFGTPELPEMPR